MSQEPIYKNLEALDPVRKLVREADVGLGESWRHPLLIAPVTLV